VGRDRWRNYFGEPPNNNSLREQFLACPSEWVTTLPFPPEEGGRYSLQNISEILASEMDMSSLSHLFKKHRPKYMISKIYFTHEKEWTALQILRNYSHVMEIAGWKTGVAQGFFSGDDFW
jgi:hypothetical protein